MNVRLFRALLDERNGIVSVDVHSAVELDDEQSKKLINELAAYTGKKVRAKLSLDEQLLGGATVKVGDTILDGSVKHQLEMLRNAAGKVSQRPASTNRRAFSFVGFLPARTVAGER